jgi:NADPH-dependent curcumin reductase CurA
VSERVNRSITLVSRPKGLPIDSDFAMTERPIPRPAPGEVLVRNLYLSMDPWVRSAMSHPSMMPQTMVVPGDAVSRVIESKHPHFHPGDVVQGLLGWQDYAAAPWYALRRIDPRVAPISTALGILGGSGLTAWFGLFAVARIKPRDTVVISAAAGAVGSAAAQLAKLCGCRVIGITGSEEKVRYLVDDLGADAAVRYKTDPAWQSKLAVQCPFGVDVYFDNVGGRVSDAVFPMLSARARVAICGQIAEYARPIAATGPRWLGLVLGRRARVQGFLVTDFAPWFPQALHGLTAGLRAGLLRSRETIEQGLENAPRAFIGMLEGRNVGKQLVKLDDPFPRTCP